MTPARYSLLFVWEGNRLTAHCHASQTLWYIRLRAQRPKEGVQAFHVTSVWVVTRFTYIYTFISIYFLDILTQI